MTRRVLRAMLMLALLAAPLAAQGLDVEPVFDVAVLADRAPLVAGQPFQLAAVVRVERGWHVNSHDPGDEFAVPTDAAWDLPEGWAPLTTTFPPGEELSFAFSEQPLRVWSGEQIIVGRGIVPASASGTVRFVVEVTAQACNNTQCLPPTAVSANVELEVAAAGTASEPRNRELFEAPPAPPAPGGGSPGAAAGLGTPPSSPAPGSVEARLAAAGLPLQLLLVFLAGLALNLTPCVYPLIPITVGFFAQQGKERAGGTFVLAVLYVLGMSVTYSVLGVAAALTGRLFGAALQSPVVIVGIAVVMVALALSMFGVWELRVPGWAMRVGGGRGGAVGAVVMGLVVGFVAAPCIGPFVLGLLTYVGQVGSPVLGFALFFTLALGLGVPYLLLGTFTGAVQKLPAAGGWMIGVRKVFGVLLLGLAAYFVGPLLPGQAGGWLMAGVLLLGGLYLLVVDRTGHEQPWIDRVMRLVAAALIVVGVLQLPHRAARAVDGDLAWQQYDDAAVQAALDGDKPVIIDFYADWCAPCRELDEKTFSDPRVVQELSGYARFKADFTTRSDRVDRLTERFKVRGMPTVTVIRGGREVFRITGFEPPERFLERLRAVGS